MKCCVAFCKNTRVICISNGIFYFSFSKSSRPQIIMKELVKKHTLLRQCTKIIDHDNSVTSNASQKTGEPDNLDLHFRECTEEEELVELDKIVHDFDELQNDEIDYCTNRCESDEDDRSNQQSLIKIEPNSKECDTVINKELGEDNLKFETKVCTITDSSFQKTDEVEQKPGQLNCETTVNYTACVKKFLDKDTNNKHMTTHSNVSAIKSINICKEQHITDTSKKLLNNTPSTLGCIKKKKIACKGHLFSAISTHSNKIPYTCTVCRKKFVFKTHLRSHSHDKPYKCKICQSRFANKMNTHRHKNIRNGIKPFTCDICQRNFIKKNNLECHIRTHTGLILFACNICSDTFKSKRNLITHLGTHTIKPYKCDICKSKFTDKSNLIVHMQTHNYVKSFSCNICPEKFELNRMLVIHMKMHSGKSLYACSVCNNNFSHNSNLVKHMRTHTKEKPFSCKICQHRFAKKKNLNCHLRTHKIN